MARKKTVTATDADVARLVDRDLTAFARAGKLPQAFGVEEAVTELLALIGRGDKHPLLAGDPGVGKTALVQEAARRIVEGRVEPALQGARVVEVSLATLLAREGRRAVEATDELIDHLSRQPGAIVYVPDFAVAEGGPLMPVMVRALRSGGVRFILESDLRHGHQLLRSNEALAERAHLLVISEPDPEQVRWILSRVAEDLEIEHALPIDPEACDMAHRLAAKFLLAQRMPRKAIELLRETVAEVAAAGRERVTARDVLTRFCSATRLPRFVVDDAMPLDLDQTARFFADRILGQHEAVNAVLRSVALLKAGLNDPRRPLGVFLFAGPTGVGKTHLAKLLAEYLFGSADRLVRLNMADYAHEGAEAIPFGAPWGASWQQKRGELTRLLDGKVFAVLLLDEFEKAHRGVHDRFLQLFDEGQFINAAGETVQCANTLIVATSNVGAEVYRDPPIGFSGSRTQAELLNEVDRRIADAFRPEFLNRFDAICHFHPLTRIEIRKIAQREVGRVIEREGIRSRGLDVEVAPEVVDLLVERGYSPLFGARFLKREIEKTLTAALAVEIVKRPLQPGTPVRVEAKPSGDIVARAEPIAPPKEATAQLVLPTRGAATVRRRLDKRSLQHEVEALWERANAIAVAAGRAELEARRRALLDQSQAPDFWDDPQRAAGILRGYRALDAQLGDMDRVVRAAGSARRLVREAKTEQHLVAVAKTVEDVAREVQLLEARTAAGASTGIDDVLLEVEAAAETPGAQAWVKELLHMYLGWAERRGYEKSAIAEGRDPTRVLLRLSGPGVLGFLAGEAGLHRRIDEDARVGAYVRPRRWPALEPDAELVSAKEFRRRPGRFLERVGAEVSARDEQSGRAVVLEGTGNLAELRAAASALLDPAQVPTGEVRRYFVGRAPHVEDPRTGAFTPRVKDVLRGELEVFIAAWVSRSARAAGSR
ncbi:MAG: AAA family ATPase [Myxococcaceae bacterium]|nr:AAA family ATPase [Myxococcaceae bacterium]